VSLDGRDLGTRGLERGWQRYEWTVPAGAAAARTNVLALTIEDDGTGASSDPSARRLAVSDVRAVYDEGASVEPPSALPPCS
jgi:hypothetical protein